MNSKVLILLIPFLIIFCLNTPISLAKDPEIQLVVFDFDGTITDQQHRKPLLPENESAFKDLVRFLIKKNIHVGVATYGSNPRKMLDNIFGKENPFHKGNIMHPNRIDPLWEPGSPPPKGYNKNTMLKKLRRYYHIHQKNAVLLIDDSLVNIRNADNEGYLTYQVDPPYKGMSLIAPGIKEMIEKNNKPVGKSPSRVSYSLFRAFFFFPGLY